MPLSIRTSFRCFVTNNGIVLGLFLNLGFLILNACLGEIAMSDIVFLIKYRFKHTTNAIDMKTFVIVLLYCLMRTGIFLVIMNIICAVAYNASNIA